MAVKILKSNVKNVFRLKIWLSSQSTSLSGWLIGPMAIIRITQNIYTTSEMSNGTVMYLTASRVEIKTKIEAKKQEK